MSIVLVLHDVKLEIVLYDVKLDSLRSSIMMLLRSFRFGCYFILLLYGRKSLRRQYYSRKKSVSQTPRIQDGIFKFRFIIFYVLIWSRSASRRVLRIRWRWLSLTWYREFILNKFGPYRYKWLIEGRTVFPTGKSYTIFLPDHFVGWWFYEYFEIVALRSWTH